MLRSETTVYGFACFLKNHINRPVCLFKIFLIHSYQTFFDVVTTKQSRVTRHGISS